MPTQIQLRRDTASDWTSNDPTLAAGEFGYESDTGKVKVGDGSTAWTSLAYRFSDMTGAAIVAAIDTQLGNTDWKAKLTNSEVVAAVDAQLGSSAWQTAGLGQSEVDAAAIKYAIALG
jgi:hypothetical protein